MSGWPPIKQVTLLFNLIRKIDLEIHNQCNRTCAWCPNNLYKKETYEELPEETFKQVLSDVTSGGFGTFQSIKTAQIVTLARYNEPLMYPDLLIDRVNQARAIILDTVDLEINTNGDYLTKELIKELDIETLSIMDYDNRGMEYWKDRFADLGIVFMSELQDKHELIGMTSKIKKVFCRVNWPEFFELEDRGATVDISSMKYQWNRARRKVPCIEPSYMISIESNGNVMGCYNTRSDVPFHKDFVMGNVKEESIVNIYKSKKAEEIRSKIINLDWENYPLQCRNCSRIRVGKYPGIYKLKYKDWNEPEKMQLYLKE